MFGLTGLTQYSKPLNITTKYMVDFYQKITGTKNYFWKAASLLEWMNKGWPNINFWKDASRFDSV